MSDRLKKLDVEPGSFRCRGERPLVEWLDEGWQVIGYRVDHSGFPYSREVLIYRPPSYHFGSR